MILWFSDPTWAASLVEMFGRRLHSQGPSVDQLSHVHLHRWIEFSVVTNIGRIQDRAGDLQIFGLTLSQLSYPA